MLITKAKVAVKMAVDSKAIITKTQKRKWKLVTEKAKQRNFREKKNK